MSQTHDEIRALRMMVEEVRAEPVPELDWDAIEQRLLSRIPAHPALRSVTGGSLGAPRPRNPLVRVFGFAAAAAALALGIGSVAGSGAMPAATANARHRVQVAAVAFEPGSAQVRDLSALRAGDVVEAGDAPLRFGRAGLAAWTLTPGSVVRVVSTGDAAHDGVRGVWGGSSPPSVDSYTVALERGAIRAEVTPRDPAEGLVEAFAVEVGGTRVAVHGTAFSVKIDGDRAIVDVEHGAVAVGPVGHVGVTTGHLLVGPSRATFSLDGGRSARLLGRAEALVAVRDLEASEPAAPAAARTAPAASPVAVAAADAPIEPEVRGAPAAAVRPYAGHAAPPDKPEVHAPAAQPATPEAPPEPPRLNAAIVQSRLNRCARLSYGANAGGDSVTTISSTLRIDVNPDGSIRSMRVDPPLKPEMMNCVGASVTGSFPESTGHVDVPFSFQP